MALEANHVDEETNTRRIVQLWTSVSLAAFAAAILFSARKLHPGEWAPCFASMKAALTIQLLNAAFWGILADRTSNRRDPMIAGLVLLASATLLLCFMRNVAMLILGRIFQGMTSSLTWSVGLALVVDTIPPERIGRAMGWIGTATSLGTVTSPLLSGVVNARGGYYAVWALCFAMIGCDIVLRLLIIEPKTAAQWIKRTDSAATQTTQATDLSLSTESTETIEVGGSQVGSLRDSESEKAASVHCTRSSPFRSQHLSIQEILSLFRSPRILTALWGTVVEAVTLSAFDGTLPIFVEELFHWDTIGTGLIFLPLTLPTFLSPVIGMACDRYGPRWLSTFGFVWYAPFIVCLRFVSENTLQHKIMLCGLLVGVGVGEAFTFGPLTAEITYAVEDRFRGRKTKPIALAYAMYNMAFSLGAMTGPLLGGFIRENSGWASLGVTLGVVSIVTSIPCALFIGGAPLWKTSRGERRTRQRTSASANV